MPPEQLLGDDEPEHRVAQELQPLVGRQPTVLVGEGPMRHGALHQRIGQAPTELPDELVEVLAHSRASR